MYDKNQKIKRIIFFFKKLSSSCQKVVKKLSKSCQKKLLKSCQKVVVKLAKSSS
jgi:hypothetical protein